MDYKLKYLKYKAKYLKLKKDQEAGDLPIEILGKTNVLFRGIKKMFKSSETTDSEIKEINRIVNEYNLLVDLPRDKNKIIVRDFLDSIKNKINTSQDEKFKKDLNYLLKKHYMCKKYTLNVYDVDECFSAPVKN
jgi:hypothetical protein